MIEILKKITLFAEVDDRALEEIAAFCTIRHCTAGEVLVDQKLLGEDDRDLFLLVDGLVEVVARLPEGSSSHEVRLDNLDYEVLGEIAWVLGHGRTATVICSRETEAIRVNGPQFHDYLDRHPEVGYRVLKRMLAIASRKLQDSNMLLFF
jgi:CRP-like cAMP-binding protein